MTPEVPTLRDGMAMLAMNGICASPHKSMTPQQVAKLAYEVADAMIAEKFKKENEHGLTSKCA